MPRVARAVPPLSSVHTLGVGGERGDIEVRVPAPWQLGSRKPHGPLAVSRVRNGGLVFRTENSRFQQQASAKHPDWGDGTLGNPVKHRLSIR